MLHLVRKTLGAGMAALTLAACGGDATGNDPDAVVGQYVLISINALPLPVIVDQIGDDIAEVTGGTVTVDADGTFGDVTNLRFTESGVVTTEVDATQGNWTLSGTTVTFTPNDGSGTYTMTWNGQDRLTQLFRPDPNLPGFTLIYER